MRNRIYGAMVIVAITSTTKINASLDGNTDVILVHDNTFPEAKPRMKVTKFAMAMYNRYGITPYDYDLRKQHRFIERFFPRNEEELTNTVRFLREKRRSAKLRNKKATVGAVAVLVA